MVCSWPLVFNKHAFLAKALCKMCLKLHHDMHSTIVSRSLLCAAKCLIKHIRTPVAPVNLHQFLHVSQRVGLVFAISAAWVVDVHRSDRLPIRSFRALAWVVAHFEIILASDLVWTTCCDRSAAGWCQPRRQPRQRTFCLMERLRTPFCHSKSPARAVDVPPFKSNLTVPKRLRLAARSTSRPWDRRHKTRQVRAVSLHVRSLEFEPSSQMCWPRRETHFLHSNLVPNLNNVRVTLYYPPPRTHTSGYWFLVLSWRPTPPPAPPSWWFWRFSGLPARPRAHDPPHGSWLY